jgi:hypothetical protein
MATNSNSNNDQHTLHDVTTVTRGDLVDWAVQQGLLTEDQAEPLWQRLAARQRHAEQRQPRLSSVNVAYYMGTAIIAMGLLWILYLAWSRLWGGRIVLMIAIL